MAKRKKTREQKKLADLRHNFNHSVLNTAVFTPKIQLQQNHVIKSQQNTTQALSINAYTYLLRDLSKTAVLTIGILGAQIILYFLLINHALKIPGLNY